MTTPPANAEATEAVAKPVPEYRLLFLDYSARRKTAPSAHSCVKCQRDLKPGKPFRIVHLYEGAMIVHPEGPQPPFGDVSAYPVGMDCANKIGLEWTREPAQPTPSGPTYEVLKAECERLKEANAILQSQVDNADLNFEQIRMIERGKTREIQAKLYAAETKAGAMEEQVKNQVVIFQSIGRLVGVPENNDSCTVLFNTVKAALARVETAEKTIQLFGSWLDHWSIREQKPSDVYAAWDKARKESKQATRPAGIGWAA